MSGPEARRPVVSVIIPSYNAAGYIRECLDSVYRQEGDFVLEVIVVDDGSTDDTVAICREGYGLRCIEQPNRGPAAARNVALEHATGGLIAFLDSDDLWPEGKLALQLAFLREHPDIGLVVGDCRQFDEGGRYERTFFEASGRNDAYWEDPVYIRRAYAKLIDANYVTTGSVVMRREFFDKAGPFDEDLRMVEDLEFWLRVALVAPLGHVPEVCLLRRRHGENTSRDQIAMSRAHLRVLAKHLARFPADVAAEGADLRRREVREYQELGHLHARQDDYGNAMGAYARALWKRPSIRSLYYLLTALVGRLGASGGRQR